MRVPSPFRGAEEASTNAELKAGDATLQPVPGARRPDRRRARRHRARARAARAGRGRSGDARRGRARRARDRTAAGDAGARRWTRWPATTVLTDALGPVLAGSYLAVRRSEWAAYSAEDDGIRAAGPLREVLNARSALVDHHAHGILRAPPATLDEFRGLFSESTDPRQWPHVATASRTGGRSARWPRSSASSRPRRRCFARPARAATPTAYAARAAARPPAPRCC